MAPERSEDGSLSTQTDHSERTLDLGIYFLGTLYLKLEKVEEENPLTLPLVPSVTCRRWWSPVLSRMRS